MRFHTRSFRICDTIMGHNNSEKQRGVDAMNRLSKLEEYMDMSRINDLLRKKEEEKKCSNAILWILAVIGAVAAVAAIAYAVYRYMRPDYLEDWEDDYEDFEDDFFEDEDDLTEDEDVLE